MHNPLRTRIGFPWLGLVGDSSRRVWPLRQRAPRNWLIVECDLSADWKDTSGNGNDFSFANVGFVDNDKGYSLQRGSFNGTNSTATTGTTSVTPYSFMFLMKPNTNISGWFAYPYARGDAWNANSFAFFIYDHSSSTFQRSHCVYNGSTFFPCKTTTALSSGNTYFVGGSYDWLTNGVVDVVVDGKIENSVSITGNVATTYNNILGAAFPSSFAKFNGEIGMFRLFNRKLTPLEWHLHYLEFLSMAH